MIRLSTTLLAGVAGALALAAAAAAQPAGLTREMIMRQLPLEGAPIAVPGPYEATSELADDAAFTVFRPADLDAFPASDTLPVLAWGNGGCNRDPGQFVPFLEGIAGHGYLVITTAARQGEPGRASAEDLTAAIDWAFAENVRDGSPLAGKIDTDQVAVMGVSCGGVMTLGVAGDSRVDTIGVFNSGAGMGAPGGGSPEETLAAIHTPTLYLNGGEVDFARDASLANFEAINHVPVFYGSRDNAGHSATYSHPGGGEFANVTAAWLAWRLKGDEEASRMFVGADCTLCTDANWDVRRKGL